VLAVDDFALRRSRRYATVVIDAETRLPVDAWNTRDAESTADDGHTPAWCES
jgi:hypothetical protein